MLTATLVGSVLITGILIGILSTCFGLFACFKKQHGTLMQKSLGEFLIELGGTMLLEKQNNKTLTKIS